MKQLNDVIKVTIIYESKYTKEFTSGLNDNIENILNKFSTKYKIEKSSLYLLYNGNCIQSNEFKKKFYEVINKFDQKSKRMVMLAYKTDDKSQIIPDSDNITIFLIQDSKVLRIQGTKKESFKIIFEKSKAKIGCDLRSLDFIYRNKGIDINKKFLDIADNNDQKNNGLAIYINRKDSIFVNFLKEEIEDKCYNSFGEEPYIELCQKYAHDINMNYEDLTFTFGNKSIPKGKTIGELLIENNDISHEESNKDVITSTVNEITGIKNIKEIYIYVSEISRVKKYKKLIIILSIIAILIFAAIIIIIIVVLNHKKKDNKSNKTCNYGYKLINNECKLDYFLIVVYNTQQKGEKINLIRQYSYIEYIFIEGKKIVLDTINYQFEEEGDHTVYIQFKKANCYNSRLFKGNKNINSVNFTDFNEY